jgi:hypothetical protein
MDFGILAMGTNSTSGVCLETHKTTFLSVVDNLCRIGKHCRLELKSQDEELASSFLTTKVDFLYVPQML